MLGNATNLTPNFRTSTAMVKAGLKAEDPAFAISAMQSLWNQHQIVPDLNYALMALDQCLAKGEEFER